MEFLQEYSAPLMFIVGGLISAIIFYPGKRKPSVIDVDYLASMLSYQWYCGVHFGQSKEYEVKIEEHMIIPFSQFSKNNFKPAAEIVAMRILK